MKRRKTKKKTVSGTIATSVEWTINAADLNAQTIFDANKNVFKYLPEKCANYQWNRLKFTCECILRKEYMYYLNENHGVNELKFVFLPWDFGTLQIYFDIFFSSLSSFFDFIRRSIFECNFQKFLKYRIYGDRINLKNIETCRSSFLKINAVWVPKCQKVWCLIALMIVLCSRNIMVENVEKIRLSHGNWGISCNTVVQ